MGLEGWWVAGIVITIILLLVLSRLKPLVIFLSAAGALYLSNLITLEQLLSNYVNPSLVTLLLLVLVSTALEKSQLFRWVASFITAGSARTAVLRMGFLGGLLSALVNNTAVVAALLGPLKRQSSLPASRLLLPLSYASILGGTLTLIGTSTNLIINGFVQQAGLEPLGFFDFTWVGLPVFAVCLGVMLLSVRLLPATASNPQAVNQDYFLERRVQADSPIVGRSVQDSGLRRLESIFLVEVVREGRVISPVSPQEKLQADDVLVFCGDISALDVLNDISGLSPFDDHSQQLNRNLLEVIVSPSASLVGQSIRQADFRARFNAAVVAVRRGSQRLQGGLGPLCLQAGDALVLAVGDDFRKRQAVPVNLIVVGEVAAFQSLSSARSSAVVAGFVLTVALAASGVLPLMKGLVVLLAGLLLFGVVTVEELKTRFPFELLLVIGSALGVSLAMINSGLANTIGVLVGSVFNGGGPMAALVGVFVMTWLLTELITNNAAAALAFPVALALSQQLGVSHLPFVMAVAFGASASFLSPYGYQTNLMVFSLGHYRVMDFWKFGLPVLLAYGAVALVMIPRVFPFVLT